MTLADPIERAIAMVARVPKDDSHDRSRGAQILEAAMAREAGTVPLLVEQVAQTIYSYDQDFIDRPWSRLGEISRQTYHEIAEAVIAQVRAA
jgi:hypothetical protein